MKTYNGPRSWHRSVIVEKDGKLELRMNKHVCAADERFVCVVNKPKTWRLCNQLDLINKRRRKG